jgi:hypothetical protein
VFLKVFFIHFRPVETLSWILFKSFCTGKKKLQYTYPKRFFSDWILILNSCVKLFFFYFQYRYVLQTKMKCEDVNEKVINCSHH